MKLIKLKGRGGKMEPLPGWRWREKGKGRARATYEGLILVQCCVCTPHAVRSVSSTLCHAGRKLAQHLFAPRVFISYLALKYLIGRAANRSADRIVIITRVISKIFANFYYSTYNFRAHMHGRVIKSRVIEISGVIPFA